MGKKKILFVTGSRADYGIVRTYLGLLNEDKHIDLSIIATGALLSSEFGHQVELIYKDGFNVEKEIEISVDTSSNASVIHSMAIALDKFGRYFASEQPTLLIILGDRYEMLSVAIAAAMNRIPILHLHGGEATYGNYDEFIRHSISKMSLFHFTATEEYRNRVIQLGESPDRVYNIGALGAENCLRLNDGQVPIEIKNLVDQSYFVVLFHPETLTNTSVDKQVEELLKALDEYKSYNFVFLGSNADTNSNVIRTKVEDYVKGKTNCIYFENLPTAGYHYLLKHSIGLIGNSSSGLIEAPSLGIYTVNIGDRQAGRVRGNSVIDVKCTKDDISQGINRIVTESSEDKKQIYNPYYKENTARNYYAMTLGFLEELDKGMNDYPKKFYDMPE